MSIAEFETIAMNVTLTVFMFWMVAIIWKLGKDSGGGKWAYIALSVALGMGLVGFIAKIVLVEFVLKVS